MRPGEITHVPSGGTTTKGLTRDHLDFKKRMIILKPEDTKTKIGRNIPITDEILEILRRIPTDLRTRHLFSYKGKAYHDIRGSVRKNL